MAGRIEPRQLENVCRLCLTDASEAGDMLPIFPIRGGNPNSPSSVVNRILQCTSLKIEPAEGVPSTICELCSVRLEDWYAFREQCLGTDEYLRVALRHAFSLDESFGGVKTATSSPASYYGADARSSSETYTPPQPVTSHQQQHQPPIAKLSLAKRRQSTMEWSVADPTGNGTGQKVIVEVVGICSEAEGKAAKAHDPSLDDGVGPMGQHHGADVTSRRSLDTVQLEQASWSKEYSARINSLMMMVNGARPYKCKICRKLFKTRNNLRRHIKCNHCDEVLEGESPPPECYDYGHIDRVGIPRPTWEQQQEAARTQAKKKRKSTDPPIVGPFRCTVCPRSFKMPAHLAVHRKTHKQIDVDRSQLMRALEEQGVTSTAPVTPPEVTRMRPTTNIEPSDIIQLSDDDDDDDDDGGNAYSKAVNIVPNGTNDDLDDGFDEEEGSLKEASSLEPLTELQPDPSALAIVVIGADDDVRPEKRKKLNGDQDVVVIQDVPAEKRSPMQAQSFVPSSRPGPLSSKLKAAQQQLVTVRPKEQLFKEQSPSPSSIGATPAKVNGATASSSSSPGHHRCHFCRQTFAREDLLREHQKTHQGETACPFRCGWCKKGFRYRQNYTLHLEKQTCRLMNADPVRGLQQQQQASVARCS